MATPTKLSKKHTFSLASIADAATCYCALVLVTLLLLSFSRASTTSHAKDDDIHHEIVRGNQILDRPCEEIYVVGEGETLHTISDKCGDPFIVEENPHIHDPDDVFPGLVIKVTPSRTRKLLNVV
ncbi:hypothetical protein Tsubulata_032622 [Turnera subulata]|uniref:LysM domain-containing protein n=1 Tax=Turnera subulata TaxID=218843 RepID=A0A9Q0G2H4_9ROSI|nr:hypothetical protein Tsubulata_032622 [Turnera subulata]